MKHSLKGKVEDELGYLYARVFTMGNLDGKVQIADIKQTTDKLLTLFRKEMEGILEDWEVAIRFSQNDEDEVPIEKRQLSELVMVNHLKATKERVEKLKAGG